MGLSKKLLESIRSRAPFSGVTESVVASSEVGSISCQLTEVDRLACSLVELTLATEALAGVSMDSLTAISEELSARLTYLLEPVAPIERDDERCVIQMRSKPPRLDDDGTRYFELVVERGRLSLLRYHRGNQTARQRVPAEVTLEVLGRLVDDFEAVVPA